MDERDVKTTARRLAPLVRVASLALSFVISSLTLGCIGVPPAPALSDPPAPHDDGATTQDAVVVGDDGAAGAGVALDAGAGDDGAAARGSPDGGPPGPLPNPESYAFVVLPDTQYYASSWPDIFAAQTRWIVENKDSQGIAFVLHAGDIVDTDVPEQWEPAAHSLQMLDGQVPYVLAAGNHDYTNLADRTGLFNAYFPPSHFAQDPWFAGTFEAGHSENSFSLIEAGGGRWLVMSLEFGPRDEVLSWANAVLSLFHDTPAIIVTHAYLEHHGSRYDHSSPGGARYNPHDYVMMGQPGSSINDGEEMWKKLVEPHGNVKFVFSGHDVGPDTLPPGTTGRLTSTRADGTRVHQILANYQTCLMPPCETNGAGDVVHGGNGFLRVVKISPADHTASVTTYSPYVDQFLTDDANQFTLPFD